MYCDGINDDMTSMVDYHRTDPIQASFFLVYNMSIFGGDNWEIDWKFFDGLFYNRWKSYLQV